MVTLFHRKRLGASLFSLIGVSLAVVAVSQTKQPWFEIQQLVIQADLKTDRTEQKKLASRALELSDLCLKEHPKEVGCFYYRGQAKGLLAKNVILGYPSKVRSMLNDWKMALDLDPTFNYGGPHRMFAEVYTALPKGLGPKDLRQDLQLAIQHIEKAIKISNYPTNHLDMAEALLKSKQKEKAKGFLQRAKQSLPEWKTHPYYSTWQTTLKELEEKLK